MKEVVQKTEDFKRKYNLYTNNSNIEVRRIVKVLKRFYCQS